MYNANKLKVQLRLAVNRLKMMQNKKASINAQQRREIASLLEKGKEESARIRVEHIIREDYSIEAMEMVEIFCEMLLARFGLIEQMKQCDPSIIEAASSIIYAALRCEAQELMIIKEHLAGKYGKEFVANALENKNNVVNERLVQKLKVKVPSSKLVTRYLVEIARNYNVAWSAPDDDLEESLMGDSTLDAEFSLPNAGKGGKGSGPGASSGSRPGGGAPPSSSSSSSSRSSPSPSSSVMPSASPSLLDDMFPPAPSSSAKQTGEESAGDDGQLPDFDELTKRFEALKKRQ